MSNYLILALAGMVYYALCSIKTWSDMTAMYKASTVRGRALFLASYAVSISFWFIPATQQMIAYLCVGFYVLHLLFPLILKLTVKYFPTKFVGQVAAIIIDQNAQRSKARLRSQTLVQTQAESQEQALRQVDLAC